MSSTTSTPEPAPALKPRPRRWTWAWSQSLVGDRVEIIGVQRWKGRTGAVTSIAQVAAGGANPRECLLVDLEPTGRAAARTVKVYPSSVAPLE